MGRFGSTGSALLTATLTGLLLLAGCRTGRGPTGTGSTGIASYYSDKLAGRPTASGEPYDPDQATCAHRRLAFGTVVEIVVVETGARASCRINDRGPFVRGRIIDVSRAVAEQLKLFQRGLARVRIRVLP